MKKLKSILRAFSDDLRHFVSKWTIAPFIAFFVAYGLAVGSCGQTTHIPTTSTTVEIKDSVEIHIRDSIRIVEKSRFKDIGWLGDTLRLAGTRSMAWAVADTTKGVLIGGLEEDRIEEHHSSTVKEKLVEVHDTTRIEVPVPVEITKEVRTVPWIYKFLSGVGLISILLLLVGLGLKIMKLKGTGFLKFIKN